MDTAEKLRMAKARRRGAKTIDQEAQRWAGEATP